MSDVTSDEAAPKSSDTPKPVEPMWEAMDCPDVTDDPWYQ